jgi:Bacterial regulatory proteins, luxR family
MACGTTEPGSHGTHGRRTPSRRTPGAPARSIETACGVPASAYAILVAGAEQARETDLVRAASMLTEAGQIAWGTGDLPRLHEAAAELAELPDRTARHRREGPQTRPEHHHAPHPAGTPDRPLRRRSNTNRTIAGHLLLSPRTVDYRLHKIFTKLGLISRAELVRLSLEDGGRSVIRDPTE